MNQSRVRYNPPQERYVRVSNSIVDMCSPDVIGIYCKLIKISYGKTLSIDIIAKRINVSEKKVRKVIVELEEAGYVVREPIKNEQNKMCGWDYQIYADPVPEEERSHAGKKKQEKQIPVLPILRQDGKPDKTENGQDNIIIDNSISNNINKDLDNNNKKSTNVDEKKEFSISLFPNQKTDDDVYNDYMKENYPYIMKMDKPLTRAEAKKLKELYGEDIVVDVFNAMNNCKQLVKKYRSAYHTANNWCTRRIQNKPSNEQRS